MKLIVGLGNPGREYVGTRHNVGFDAIETLAARLGWMTLGSFSTMAKENFGGLVFNGAMETAEGSQKLLLVKPLTFMNLSGRCVQAAAAFYKVEPKDILVIVDDLALPLGKLRLKPGGSHGGQNGLRNIEQMLGTNKYPRLRIGIDPPPPRVNPSDWVLGKFFEEQRPAVDEALLKAAACAVTWAEHGPDRAMNQFNAPPEPKKRKSKPKPAADEASESEGPTLKEQLRQQTKADKESAPSAGCPPEPGL